MYADLVNSIKAYTSLPLTVVVEQESITSVILNSQISQVSQEALVKFLGVWFNKIKSAEKTTLYLTEDDILIEANGSLIKTELAELYSQEQFELLDCPLNIKGFLEPFSAAIGPKILTCSFEGGGDSGDWSFPDYDWTLCKTWKEYKIEGLEKRVERLSLLLELFMPDFNGDPYKEGTIVFNLENYTVQITTTAESKTEVEYYGPCDYFEYHSQKGFHSMRFPERPFDCILDTAYLILYNNYVYTASIFGVKSRREYIAPPIKTTLYSQIELHGDGRTKSINYLDIAGLNGYVKEAVDENKQVLDLVQVWAHTLPSNQLVVLTEFLDNYSAKQPPYCWHIHTQVPHDIPPPNYQIRKSNWFESLLDKSDGQLYTVAMILAEIKYFEEMLIEGT